MDIKAGNLLAQQFQETRRQLRKLWFKLWGVGLLVVVFGFLITWFFVKPAPPRQITIAAGPRDGAYYAYASQYASVLERHGVELEVLETAGSIENCELLETDRKVQLAIVQGGTIPQQMVFPQRMESLASLYLEPVWVFYRSSEPYGDLRDLCERKIAVGRHDSGTRAIAETLLAENGVISAEATELVEVGGRDAMRWLLEGTVDAAFFVLSPETPLVRRLVQNEEMRLLSFERHAAYARIHPYLSETTLRRGAMDLAADLPARDIPLIAPAANLVAATELHDALVPLLLKAATQVHEHGDVLVRKGRFPSTEFVETPLNESARLYFEHGPPFLQKYLPFWVASAIDRGKILLLPAITLLLPLFKIAPPLYRWRIRSRIYRWYELLRQIELDITNQAPPETLEKHRLTLSEMELELDELDSVPLPYMEEFYNLRLHVEFVERRVKRAEEDKPEATEED